MKLLISDLDDTLFDTTGQLDETYTDIHSIQSFPGLADFLSVPRFRNFLVSAGAAEIQNAKIDILKLRPFFTGVHLCDTNDEKLGEFKNILRLYGKGLTGGDIFVVGNRIDSEIRFGNMLGLTTILIKQGKYADAMPKDGYEVPRFSVSTLAEATTILKNAQAHAAKGSVRAIR